MDKERCSVFMWLEKREKELVWTEREGVHGRERVKVFMVNRERTYSCRHRENRK